VVTLVAAVAIGLLFIYGIQSLRVTDAEIAAGPPEDTLGFGVWPVLLLFGGPAFVAVFWLWRQAISGRSRTLAALATVLLISAAGFSIWAYGFLRARVFK
jgi:hypothetical protein